MHINTAIHALNTSRGERERGRERETGERREGREKACGWWGCLAGRERERERERERKRGAAPYTWRPLVSVRLRGRRGPREEPGRSVSRATLTEARRASLTPPGSRGHPCSPVSLCTAPQWSARVEVSVPRVATRVRCCLVCCCCCGETGCS